MSIATDVKVKNLGLEVDRLKREVSELRAKIELMIPPSKETVRKQSWISKSLQPS